MLGVKDHNLDAGGQVFIVSLGILRLCSFKYTTEKGNRQDLGCGSKDTAVTVETKYETSPPASPWDTD